MKQRDFRFCEGFRMPAHDDGATHTGGRRPQTSNGDAMGRASTRILHPSTLM